MLKRALNLILGGVIFLSLFSLAAWAEEDDCLYYFYGLECSDCAETDRLIKGLAAKYPGVVLEKSEVYFDKGNAQLLQDYFTAYGVSPSSQQLPAVFMRDSYLVGQEPILNLLEDRILENTGSSCPSLERVGAVGVVGKGSPKNVLDTLTFFAVAGAAWGDSIKAGALALLLILLVVMLNIRRPVEMLEKGLVFIAGIYLAYFLFGAGLFSWFAYREGLGSIFARVIGLLAVLFGLLKVKDFFFPRLVFRELIGEWRSKLKPFFHLGLSHWGIFLTGLVASFFTFAGASNVFLSLRVLFADSGVRNSVWPWLLLHGLFFVLLPLVVAVGLYYTKRWLYVLAHRKGHSDLTREAWRKHNVRVLNLVVGLVLIFLGLGAYLG